MESVSSPVFQIQGGQPASATAPPREQVPGQAPSLSIAPGSHRQSIGVGAREETCITSVVIFDILLCPTESRKFLNFPLLSL